MIQKFPWERPTTFFLGEMMLLNKIIAATATATLFISAHAESIWMSTGYDIYSIDRNGGQISKFNSSEFIGTQKVIDTVAYDYSDGTLWTVSEITDKVYNISKSGRLISSFPTSTFDSYCDAIEGVAVDPRDYSLWIVDDEEDLLYHVERDGTLTDSWETNTFGDASQRCPGPQGVVIDFESGNIWISDNEERKILQYRIDSANDLVHISDFDLDSIIDTEDNVQALGYDVRTHTLWLATYDTIRDVIWNISKNGQLIKKIENLPSGNPSGVAIAYTPPVKGPLMSHGGAPLFNVEDAPTENHHLSIFDGTSSITTPFDYRPYGGLTTAGLWIQSESTKGVLLLSGKGSTNTAYFCVPGQDLSIYTNGALTGSHGTLGTLGIYVSSGKIGIGTSSPSGTLDVNGSIYQRGGVLHADYVFEKDYQLESIEEHSEFMWKNKHLPGVPAAERLEDGTEIKEYGAHTRGILEELEKAHCYIEQLNERLKKQEKIIEQLLSSEASEAPKETEE